MYHSKRISTVREGRYVNTILPKHQMNEEDIKFQYTTASITSK